MGCDPSRIKDNNSEHTELLDKSYPLVVWAKNISSRFSSLGLFRPNKNDYTDADFLAVNVIDVPSACIAYTPATEHVVLSHESHEANKSRSFT